jgi:arginyl-tRNA synthetase
MDTATPTQALRDSLAAAAAELGAGDGATRRFSLERPPRPDFGDYSSNVAMLAAGSLGSPPREIAEKLAENLPDRLGAAAERVEVAGPGFINVFLSGAWFAHAVSSLSGAEGQPVPQAEAPQRINVEFVSANPTGPLTAAGGRHAAFGDSVSRLLEAQGHTVEREYYVNDAGGQVERFAASIAARMDGGPVPEDGYAGEYVASLAEEARGAGLDSGDREALGRFGVDRMVAAIKATLSRFGVEHARYSSERELRDGGRVGEVLEVLRAADATYESEGALWLRSSDHGDDKDRVLIRTGGEPTYLAPDIAYHRDKLSRSDLLIDVLGADHHGYLQRMRAAIAALGEPPEALEALLMQLVQVVERGQRSQMSKRRGDFVTLDELVDDIGVDAARFFMLQRSHDTAIDLDLDLARRQSSDNPVYYVQYAHARIASILRKAESEGAAEGGGVELAAPTEQSERDLIKRLLDLPAEVTEAAERRAPHRLCAYATAIAADFHSFYRDCKVVGAEGEGVQEARLALCRAAKSSIAQVLGLLGITAPERM